MEDIAKMIDVDTLGFLSVENALRLAGDNADVCAACFDGMYPAGSPEHAEKDRFE